MIFRYPGIKVKLRSENLISIVETELIKGSKHSPPTTQEYRNWLNIRIKESIPN